MAARALERDGPLCDERPQGLHLLLGLELDQDHLAGIAEDVIGAL